MSENNGTHGAAYYHDEIRRAKLRVEELKQDAKRRGFDPHAGSGLPTPIAVSKLIEDYPTKREPIVDGLFRRGETVNVIGAPKAGKSWFIYGMLYSVATGRDWLGMPTTQGRVLLVDNEIHPEELSSRFAAVSRAMAIPDDIIRDSVEVIPLRGRLHSIDRIGLILDSVKSNAYSLIVLDAFYRVLPEGVSENDNAQMASVYNTIDNIAGELNTALVLNHHTTKGDQSHKGVTDVGSGAGAIARAADCHLIVRSHELEGCAVLEGVCRSFPPIDPMTIAWEWPLWSVKDGVEPALKRTKSAHKQDQEQRDQEGTDKIRDFLSAGPKSMGSIRKLLRCGAQRADRLVGILEDAGEVTTKTRRKRDSKQRVQVVELVPEF